MSSNADDANGDGADWSDVLADGDYSNIPEEDTHGNPMIPLTQTIAASYCGQNGGIKLDFHHCRPEYTDGYNDIWGKTVPFNFYDDRTQRGELKNSLVDQVKNWVGDEVSKAELIAGFDRMCSLFEDVISDEELRPPMANKLIDETERVIVHIGDEEAQYVIKLETDDGTNVKLKFDNKQWVSDDAAKSLNEQYNIRTQKILGVGKNIWKFVRNAWNERIDHKIENETGESDVIAHELIRLLNARVNVVEDADDLWADPMNALYDADNANRPDTVIWDNHGEVDVLWVQAAAIDEALTDIPGAKPDRSCKSPLAALLAEEGTLLRGSKQVGPRGRRVSAWAFDAEVFGGRELIGEGDDDGNDQVVGL